MSSLAGRMAYWLDAVCGGTAGAVRCAATLHLLPVLIVGGSVLFTTLRAYVLLKREVRRRKRTEQQLATQLSFRKTMMEMVPYPLIAKDHEGRYIAVNRAFELTLGVRREDVIGRTCGEAGAWGEQHSATLERLTQEVLRTGVLRSVEFDFRNYTGETRHGLFWVGTCAGIGAAGPGVICTMVDISEIRRAERRARETERRLFDVTRTLPAVVFQLRRDANGQYSLAYVGGDVQRLLGRDAAALLEVDAFRLVCDEDRVRVLDELERSALSQKRVLTEFCRNGPGPACWVRAEFAPRRERDGSVVWSGYWADASAERTRADELARARDLAEAASKAKDDFLATMSHEIRTPMNGVLGLVEVLGTTPLNVDQRQMLGMIDDSAGALLQILDDLLDYSKIEAGALTIEAASIDLRELVDGAVGLLTGRAHEKGLKMRVDIEPAVAAELRGDSVRLRQILFNLLSNAIKFTLAGEVAVRVAVARQTDECQHLEISVTDTGIGIAPEVQARLFEPFVQAETSTTRRFGGTGLGLTICRRLIALMGGELALESTPGVGTKMAMRLSMPVERRRYAAGELCGKRGLVGIDDVETARAIVHFGTALGMQLRRIAPDGAELADPGALAGVDLIFLRHGFASGRLASRSLRIVHVTDKPKAAGYRVVDDDIRLSANPLSWHGLAAACSAALTGHAQRDPRASATLGANAGPPERDDAIAHGRLVLVAEDHPVNQELIRHQLGLLGFACDVVDDGVEALAALDVGRYGLLITDCHMPKLSGYELAQRVRERESKLRGAARLPIVGITASTAPDEWRLCRDAGMDEYLVKPTRLATLREHLQRWFGVGSSGRAVTATQAPGMRAPPLTPGRSSGLARFGPEDLANMRELWADQSSLKRLLDSFVATLRDDLSALPPLVESGDPKPLRGWHHRVAGAASVLSYQPLVDALDEFRGDVVGKPVRERRASADALIEKCLAILEGIEEQAGQLA